MVIINELDSCPCMDDCTQWVGRLENIIPMGSVQDYLQHCLRLLKIKNARGRETTATCPSGRYVMIAPRVLVRKRIGKLKILKGRTFTWEEIET